MVKNDYSSEVTTKLNVWQKDMVAIAEFADAIGVATPLLTAALPIYPSLPSRAARAISAQSVRCSRKGRSANVRSAVHERR